MPSSTTATFDRVAARLRVILIFYEAIMTYLYPLQLRLFDGEMAVQAHGGKESENIVCNVDHL